MKLGLTPKELRDKILELGFELSPKARVLEDDLAELIEDDFSNSPDSEVSDDVADVYDEIISQERDRELVKSQRKQTAGRDVKDEKKKSEVQISHMDSVEIHDSITVKEFAEKTGINIAKVIGELMKNGILANINQQIDFDTAQIIAQELGVTLKRIRTDAAVDDLLAGDMAALLKEEDGAVLKERPPVVCVMGHVDHGKTKLLDTIREANVIATESGGITQHVAAYQVVKKGKPITFLDTPGHEAFTEMRARGAKVTDIAILVVAADDGVKPQTIEAANHAKEAGVPIIVAINKMDKPEANPDKVKGELTELGLQPEDWGGKTVCVPISALKGDGIDELLDMVLLTADMENLKANYERDAVGVVVEAHLDNNLGPVATVLVKAGNLKIKDNVIVGDSYGKIKLMKDHTGKSVATAGPATPVLVAGLSKTPKSGDILAVVKDEKTARIKAEQIAESFKKTRDEKMSAANQIIASVKSDKLLKLVIKADTKGSLEAIRQSIAKIKDDEVAVKIIHGGVGKVANSDIMMASASNGFVVAFHAGFDSPNVKKLAERENVEVRSYTVIYNLLEDVKKFLSGLLEPEIIEVVLGRAEVKQIFFHKKTQMVVGCKILSGKIKTKAKLRIIRGKTDEDEDNVVGIGEIESLRKGEELVKELGSGNDCGIKYKGEIVLEVGDILEAFEEEEHIRSVS